MTDAAIADSGPAPEAPVGAPINEHAPAHNSPLGSQIPPDARAENQPKPAPSISDSIDRAFERSAKDQAEKAKPEPKAETKAEVKPEPKAEPKAAPERGEGGKFVGKQPEAQAPKPAEPVKQSFTASDAPSRFSDDAKKEWATAPESVRKETERAIKELTDGFQKYKAGHEANEGLREFHEMAQKGGTTVKEALSRYVGIENKLRTDLIGGLEEVISNASQGKFSLRDIAAHVMGQKPEEQASQQDATIRELKHELAGLKQQLGGVTQTIEQQREQSTLTEINKFAADHPRFEELAEDISFFLKSGRAKDLADAYTLAERLNPAPAKAEAETTAASSAAIQDPPPVHPDKGQKSINGAPSSGSSPAGKKRAAVPLDQALDNAFRRVG